MKIGALKQTLILHYVFLWFFLIKTLAQASYGRCGYQKIDKLDDYGNLAPQETQRISINDCAFLFAGKTYTSSSIAPKLRYYAIFYATLFYQESSNTYLIM
jgi:hypothetical protein